MTEKQYFQICQGLREHGSDRTRETNNFMRAQLGNFRESNMAPETVMHPKGRSCIALLAVASFVISALAIQYQTLPMWYPFENHVFYPKLQQHDQDDTYLTESWLLRAYQNHLDCNTTQAGFSTRKVMKWTQFAVPAQLNEQLGKTVGHFADIAVIGTALNRTVVVPRVGQGGINLDSALPFCSYFDLGMSMRELEWITMEQLVANQLALSVRLKGEYVFLIDGSYPCSSASQHLRHSVQKEAEKMTDISIFNYTCYNGTNLLTSKGEILSNEATIEDALQALNKVDILFFVKARFYHQASSLNEKVARIRTRLLINHPPFFKVLSSRFEKKHLGTNYVALQWRTEKCLLQSHCNHSNFIKCSEAAVAEVGQRLQMSMLEGVFFATDMPFNGTVSKSSSFHPSLDQLQWGLDARKLFKEALDFISWDDYPITSTFDSGIRALLDKTVCAHAKYFIAAPDACGGGSFVWSIVEERPGWKFWSQVSLRRRVY